MTRENCVVGGNLSRSCFVCSSLDKTSKRLKLVRLVSKRQETRSDVNVYSGRCS
jgi:hypothetical protein